MKIKAYQLLGFSMGLASCLTVCFAAATSTELHTIDFSKEDRWKAIYDAGLKPWKYTPSESSECNLGRENLAIILPRGQSFRFDIESATIEIDPKNQVSRVDLNSGYIPILEAIPEIRNICQSIGISTKDFDDYVDKNQPAASLQPIKATLNGVQINIGFDPFGAAIDRTHFWVIMSWPQPNSPLKFTLEPLKPPPGYENVSMDPPPNDSNQKQVPAHDPEYSHNSDQQSLAQASNMTASAFIDKTKTQASGVAPLSAQNRPKAAQTSSLTTSWFSPWYGLVAILVVILTIYVCKRK